MGIVFLVSVIESISVGEEWYGLEEVSMGIGKGVTVLKGCRQLFL